MSSCCKCALSIYITRSVVFTMLLLIFSKINKVIHNYFRWNIGFTLISTLCLYRGIHRWDIWKCYYVTIHCREIRHRRGGCAHLRVKSKPPANTSISPNQPDLPQNDKSAKFSSQFTHAHMHLHIEMKI